MTGEEITNIGQPVREIYGALNSKDLAAFDRFVSEQVEYIDFSLNETFKGREAFKKHFENWWTAFPKGTGEILNLIASKGLVVVEVLGRGRQTGPFNTKRGLVEPKNQFFEFHFCQVFHIKEGQIVSGHSYSDVSQLFAASWEARTAA